MSLAELTDVTDKHTQGFLPSVLYAGLGGENKTTISKQPVLSFKK